LDPIRRWPCFLSDLCVWAVNNQGLDRQGPVNNTKGHLLVASPRLVDPNFAHAIVLVIQHGEDGALGLIVNRPLEVSVTEALEQVLEGQTSIDGTLHEGGPCDGPLMVVHCDPQAAQIEVADGVYFTAERSQIETLVQNATDPMRFFVGYAGWSPGQLERELQSGSWLVTQADRQRVFTESDLLWSRLVAEETLRHWIDPERIPPDASVN
jgi:putative transcriptional regulator